MSRPSRASLLNIYQYHDDNEPNQDDATVWIAADREERANAVALVAGYRTAGGLIYPPERHQCSNIDQLHAFGVDIVVIDLRRKP